MIIITDYGHNLFQRPPLLMLSAILACWRTRKTVAPGSLPRDGHACDDALHRFHSRLLRIDVISNLFASPQYDNAINHLKYVVNIMGDKDARVPRVAGTADEAQHPLVSSTPRLLVGSSRIIRSLSKCIARAMATACRSPPDNALIGVVGGISFVIPTRLSKSPRDLVHCFLIEPIEKAALSPVPGRETGCARSRAASPTPNLDRLSRFLKRLHRSYCGCQPCCHAHRCLRCPL